MSDVPEFRGCFAKDTVIQQPADGAYIINLDDSGNAGTHWVSATFLPNCVVYFDSFGFVPASDDLVAWLKSAGKEVVYNTLKYQDIKSNSCGWFSMMIIRQLLSGMKPLDVVMQFGDDGNEKIVAEFFN